MKRHHRFGFGAECQHDGTTRFRLWAPDARRVTLQVQIPSTSNPLWADLRRRPDGWHELVVHDLPAGSLYLYRIDEDLNVPDPASRFNPQGPSGWSQVIDPDSFEWQDASWLGRPWHEAVIYELHTGTFTTQGTFAAIESRLPELAALGITMIELMPIASFGGQHGWGYDGVLPFAPHAPYGPPEDLKHLVQEAHRHGICMLLDVVYNHFGPDGNYLPHYANSFFNPEVHTPWGRAINFEGAAGPHVRRFFIQNALYWLNEYHFDGLRLDAVHAIHDRSATHFIDELGEAISQGPARNRHVHLVLENADNEAHRLRSATAGKSSPSIAQWNDDFHHAAHVLLTGETDGYYADFSEAPLRQLGRTLAEGFAFQGELSSFGGGRPRGEASANLPATAFVNFLQNHDQIGNRAYGERISQLTEAPQLRAALAILLLSPQPPMLFMGEEYCATQPFLFFCDHHGELGTAVSAGRREEFAHFKAFANETLRRNIPDPNAAETFLSCKLHWEDRDRRPHSDWLQYTRTLLDTRKSHVTTLVPRMVAGNASYQVTGRILKVQWLLADSGKLVLIANMQDCAAPTESDAARLLYSTIAQPDSEMQPWEVRLLQS
ncbi:MAG TPA: malto-oligosyltrehalose trehalohydrolase [Steroidobacteraceae bacterium]